MNQQQTCNEQLMIPPPGHVNGPSNSIKLNLRISISPTKRLISDQFFLMGLGNHRPIQQSTLEWHLMPSSDGRRTSKETRGTANQIPKNVLAARTPIRTVNVQ
jgi:hypothetical protein